jgi:hypothetical protein
MRIRLEYRTAEMLGEQTPLKSEWFIGFFGGWRSPEPNLGIDQPSLTLEYM